MSSLTASNGDEPPQDELQPSSFSSLPRDLVLLILARVPKRHYPIVACVSKNFRSLVKSSDIYKTRSLLGKESLYVCFFHEDPLPTRYYWYSLRRIENSSTENLFRSIKFPCPAEDFDNFTLIAVGQEIFIIPASDPPLSTLRILDTRSGELRYGPSLLMKRGGNTVGLVGGKIYVIGGKEEIPAERFDLKTQTWEAAPIPVDTDIFDGFVHTTVSFDRMVWDLNYLDRLMYGYDTRDGSCWSEEFPHKDWWPKGACVIDNVLYVYFTKSGLMWYDSQRELWSVVSGLDLGKLECVGMAEYYGKLALLWGQPILDGSEKKSIWCRMIGLVRSEEGIRGIAEPSQLLLEAVPVGYNMCHCLSLSD